MTEPRYYKRKHYFRNDEIHDKPCHRFMNIDEVVEELNWLEEQRQELKKIKNQYRQAKDNLTKVGVMTNKEVVHELKKSIDYASTHEMLIDMFLSSVRLYFLDNYDVHVRTNTYGDSFSVELDWSYYRKHREDKPDHDYLSFKKLVEFCDEFECDFKSNNVPLAPDRFIFTFTDVDMRNAFFRRG